MTLYLHIGHCKTGTTAFQHWLSKNRLQLMARGLLYPTTGILSDQHYLLADYFKDTRDSAFVQDTNLFERFIDELAAWKGDAIVSSEHFALYSRVEIERLAKALTLPTVVIIGLRDQLNWASSMYSEVIRWGYCGNYNEYLVDLAPGLDYDNLLKQWDACFGRENIRVIPYSTGIHFRILAESGHVWDLENNASRPERVHVSLPPALVEAQRRCNVMGARNENINSELERILSACNKGHIKFTKNWKVPSDLIELFIQAHSSNELIAERYRLSEPFFEYGFTKAMAQNHQAGYEPGQSLPDELVNCLTSSMLPCAASYLPATAKKDNSSAVKHESKFGKEDDDANERMIQDLYLALFRRAPPPSAMIYWLDRIQSGSRVQGVVHELVHSEEAIMFRREKLFAPPGHRSSPILNVGLASTYIAKIESSPSPPFLPEIAVDRDLMETHWRELLPFLKEMPFPEFESDAFRYHLNNGSFVYGDGLMLNAMLRRYQSRKIVIVDCAWALACALDTAEFQLNADLDIVIIARERHEVDELARSEQQRYRFFEGEIQDAPYYIFDDLQRDDIVLLSTSNVLRTGGDLSFVLFDLLPRLRPGVLVQFCDMFWPFEYPRKWIIDDNRSWNAIYAVRAFLSGRRDWAVVMFNDYLAAVSPQLVHESYPVFLKGPGGALWIRKECD